MDAQNLCSYLLNLSSYDVVSEFYPYALQYYTESSGGVHWLPVCGIPEAMIVNKTLLDKYDIAIPENYAEFADACAKLQENGIKPFVRDWVADYSDHSLYAGGHTQREIGMMVKNGNIVVHLAMTELTGRDVKALVEAYLKDTGTHFRVTNKYELPIVEDKQIDKIEISY